MVFFRESASKMVGYGSINPAGEENEEEERDSVPTSPISLNKGRRGGLGRQHASQVGRKSRVSLFINYCVLKMDGSNLMNSTHFSVPLMTT